MHPSPVILDFFVWWTFGTTCALTQSPKSKFTLLLSTTLRSCTVVITTGPHVRPSHLFVLFHTLEGVRRYWTRGRKLDGSSCLLTLVFYLMSQVNAWMMSNLLVRSITIYLASCYQSPNVYCIPTTRLFTLNLCVCRWAPRHFRRRNISPNTVEHIRGSKNENIGYLNRVICFHLNCLNEILACHIYI